RRVLAFVREYEGERILVVANLSRYVQYAELDMQDYAGMTPVELFGRTEFPRIGELPYLVTLGPHNCFWFTLEGLPPYEQVQEPIEDGEVGDALGDTGFASFLLEAIARRRRFRGRDGDIIALPTPQLRREPALGDLSPNLARAEQSNTSVIFGDRLIMKLYRH